MVDFNEWGHSGGLIQMGYESVEGWKKYLDEKCTAAVCEAADQFAGMLSSLFGAATSGANNLMAKVDTLSLKPSATPSPTVGEMKKQAPMKEMSPSPELAKLAEKAFPQKFNFMDMDTQSHSHNFAPSHTPGLGVSYGQGASMAV